ncbi:MAG: class I tRNA ligase family protein [Patescibacteria group bacterium]
MNNIIADKEKEIQKFWQDNQIFEKSLAQTKNGQRYSFYDGPPFATGTPHYGHLVASLMKDVVPRFWTMRGHYVERRWGWDCHGLPIENMVEKELGFKNKKDIVEYGIANFNEYCRSKVLTYVAEWKKTIKRFGRWADMENPYKTMDVDYMESIWWVFRQLWDKGLIYEGYRSMHICPRCETTLSQSEVSEGYRDVEDLSVTWKFKVLPPPHSPPRAEGEDIPTYLLAWTTVPWSTLSTMGLAIGADFDYVKAKVKNEHLIFIKDKLEEVMAGVSNYEIIEEFKGSKMIGWEYEPVSDIFKNLPEVKNKKNAYHVFAADYVEATEGTGIVTINGSYGEVDLLSAQQNDLPVLMDVKLDGRFADFAGAYAGLDVKDAQVKFVADMEKKGLVWSSEKYTHSYPHCWRCDTPLLNYSTSSWFVKVTKIKNQALALAKQINWSPAHIKEGRFGKWLEGARDWSISRQRFWASVIPIWKCVCGEMKVLGSVDELYKSSSDNPPQITKVIFVRHGEAENNISHINSNSLDKYPLTKKGAGQVSESAAKIKEILAESSTKAVIFSSPVLRTKESAEIISHYLGLKYELSDEIKEVDFGIVEGKQLDELMDEYNPLPADKKWNFKNGQTGESQKDIQERMYKWFKKVLEENKNKIIIIISHGDPLMALINKIKGKTIEEHVLSLESDSYIQKGEVRVAYVMNETKLEIDLHKHSIDRVVLKCEKCGNEMSRIPDVLDTWFDSGSMPYAQQHYPFANKEKFEAGFPAQFIAEGVDQCRAWFYYLHVNAAAITNKIAYENVIANGIVLAQDGRKMSKKLQNYPEPEALMEKYGADALRFYLLSAPVMAAENLNFSEAGVKEAMQKVVMLLNNILNFYKLYADVIPTEAVGRVEGSLRKERDSSVTSPAGDSGRNDNVLDQWLLAKLNLLIKEVAGAMEAYDLPRAVRPIAGFIDEFSTWWLRRSRDRFKGADEKDKQQALAVFGHTLLELSKVMAPFTPFIAEQVYKEVGPSSQGGRASGEQESVHLEKWPEESEILIKEEVIKQMEQVRKIVELGLAKRAEAGIKIRQPLGNFQFSIFNFQNNADQYLKIIADELNVKKVVYNKNLGQEIELDTEITKELKLEGVARELVRTINNLRREAGLTIQDQIKIDWQSEGETIRQVFAVESLVEELKRATITKEFLDKDNQGQVAEINGEKIKLEINRTIPS